MATATEELTQGYRLRSLAVRAAALKQLTQAWSFDLGDIDGSWRKLEPAVLAITELRHRDAANLAGGYYMGHRAASGVLGTPDIQRATFDRAQAANNLHLLGPILTKKAVAANQPNADKTALVRVAGEVTRLALAGGRDTLTGTILADASASGWRRITSGKACEFCRMLASRGAVYKEQTVRFQSHGHCSCQPEPQYGKSKSITTIPEPVPQAQEGVETPLETTQPEPATVSGVPVGAQGRIDALEHGLRRASEEAAAKYLNMSVEELRAQVVTNWQGWLDTAEVRTALSSQSFAQVVNDGRFKTQFETQTSGGALNNSRRAEEEKRMFDYPEDLSPELRPFYGYMAQPGEANRFVESIYGDVQVVFGAKVRGRTSVATADTLGYKPMNPSPVDDFDYSSFAPIQPSSRIEAEDWLRPDVGGPGGEYVEAQVHGGLTTRDIAAVVLRDTPENVFGRKSPVPQWLADNDIEVIVRGK